jgi:tRNA (uracil-5-)-methyltransferase TRM9
MSKLLNKVRSDYEQIAASFTLTRQGPWEESAYLCSLIPKGSSVLDLGCGNGRLYQELKHKNVQYLGLDTNQALLQIAQRQHPEADFACLDFSRELPKLQQRFDFVVSIAALHHLPGQARRLQVFRELQKLLSPTGQLYFTVWNLQQAPYRKYLYLSRLFNWGRYGWNDTFIPWHATKPTVWRYYHAFSPRELQHLLIQSGFQKISFPPNLQGRNLTVLAA